MKVVTACFIVFLSCFFQLVQGNVLFSLQDSLPRPKIALVLSGGGAKGFAHVGVLKVIDSLNIPVDMVIGTSMGSIIGGFYAMGYRAGEIETLVRQQDWEYILTDKVSRRNIPMSLRDEYDRYALSFPIRAGHGFRLPRGLVHGQNIINLFSKLTYGKTGVDRIEDMPVKFVCITTDAVSGRQVVIDSGNIAVAMRASMSIPYIFTPVDKDDMLLIDGGMRNNFPANIARQLGADIIIGVDVQRGLKDKKELRGGNDLIDQAVYFLGEQAYAESLQAVDIYIKPDIENYRIADFYSADSLIVKGKEAALSSLNDLQRLCQYAKKTPDKFPDRQEGIFVRYVKFTGLERIPLERVKGRINFKYPGFVGVGKIQQSIDRMYGTLGFETVYYQLEGKHSDTLNFIMKEKLQNTFNVGLHFDTWENAALLLNTTFRTKVARNGSLISLNMKLSQFPRFLASYTLDNGARPGFKFEVDLNRFKFYDTDRRQKKLEVKAGTIDINTSVISVIKDSYAIGFGLNMKYYSCDIADRLQWIKSKERNWLMNYFAYVRVDTREKTNFARTGIKMTARIQKITGNGLSYKGDYSLYSGYFEVIKPLEMGLLTFVPQLYVAGFLGDKDVTPIVSQVAIGGPSYVNDLNNHLPFIGMQPYEVLSNGAVVVRGDFQFELWRRNYLIYKINVLKTDDLASLKGYKLGMGLTFAYESVIGPIEGTVSWSKANDRFGGFVNVGYWF